MLHLPSRRTEAAREYGSEGSEIRLPSQLSENRSQVISWSALRQVHQVHALFKLNSLGPKNVTYC